MFYYPSSTMFYVHRCMVAPIDFNLHFVFLLHLLRWAVNCCVRCHHQVLEQWKLHRSVALGNQPCMFVGHPRKIHKHITDATRRSVAGLCPLRLQPIYSWFGMSDQSVATSGSNGSWPCAPWATNSMYCCLIFWTADSSLLHRTVNSRLRALTKHYSIYKR